MSPSQFAGVQVPIDQIYRESAQQRFTVRHEVEHLVGQATESDLKHDRPVEPQALCRATSRSSDLDPVELVYRGPRRVKPCLVEGPSPPARDPEKYAS